MRPSLKKGIALLQMLVYFIVYSAAMAVLAPLLWRFHQAVSATSHALEDLDAAGAFLAELKADIRRARAVEADADTLALVMDDGERALYRFAGPDGGVLRAAGEEIRVWTAGLEDVAFALRGRLVTVDLELKRHEGGRLRPRLRAEALARNAR